MASVANRIPDEPVTGPPAVAMPWPSLAWFGGLLVLCYFTVLKAMVNVWSTNEDMGHGFFVPAIAAYITWQRRADILKAVSDRPNQLGLVVILWGALQLYLGTLGAELFLQRTAFVITLAGVILFLCGMRVFKIVLFPLVLLFFMVPLPAVIYNQITFPLQMFASRVAETTLGLMTIPVLRDGNILELANQRLNVVEACSGIRSLLSLTFLGLVYAYFFDTKPWMRWVLFLLTIPIAIIANAGRVTVTGLIWQYKPEWAQGFYHTMEGWIIFVVAMALMILTHQLINFIYRFTHGRNKQSPPVPA
jgi:exosortase